MDTLFVGAGSVADAYTDGVSETALSVAGVCDLDAERARSLADRVGATAFDDLDDALAAVDAPLVVNLTGHRAHADVTETALRAGRSVYSEKPLALSAERARSLVALARERGLGLDVAPIVDRCDGQRHARSLLADGRLGRVRLAYATAHVGRVTRWHDRPDSFLSVGPLFDGGVYPLTLLVSWFGPVETVRVADGVDAWPDRGPEPTATPHVEATLEHAAGPTVRLTASLYAPHRAREFYGLELHGDDGSLYVRNAGALAADADGVAVGGLGREYVDAPHPAPRHERPYAAGPERLAEAIDDDAVDDARARRGAHVVAVCEAVDRATATDGAVAVDSMGATASPAPSVDRRSPTPETGAGAATLDLPPAGVDVDAAAGESPPVGAAVDAGCRLFVGGQGEIEPLDGPGGPDRASVLVVPRVDPSGIDRGGDAVGGDTVDDRPAETADRPAPDPDCLLVAVDDDPVGAWRAAEAAVEAGRARTIGLDDPDPAALSRVVDAARIPPAAVAVERSPARPRRELSTAAREAGARILSLPTGSAPSDAAEAVADAAGTTARAVALAREGADGAVPLARPADAVDALRAARLSLTDEQLSRLAEGSS